MKYRAYSPDGTWMGTLRCEKDLPYWNSLRKSVDKHGGWIEDETGKVVYGAKPAGSVDITPTWTAILPLLLLAYTQGTSEGKRLAETELKRMAAIADKHGGQPI